MFTSFLPYCTLQKEAHLCLYYRGIRTKKQGESEASSFEIKCELPVGLHRRNLSQSASGTRDAPGRAMLCYIRNGKSVSVSIIPRSTTKKQLGICTEKIGEICGMCTKKKG